ncbi:MAG: PQQ-binding-like beta-propeller repeat protein [candidate division WOR-3 bacterium]|nr:PQQ-binding-like beta-propeller repeat protein [candidate division WOR-3 bacterium]
MILIISCRQKNKKPEVQSGINGPSIGCVNISYNFSASANDPDGDSVAIRFEWGDWDTSDWSTWFANDDFFIMSHSWMTTDSYFIKAQAKDKVGAVSNWSESHLILITTNQPPNNPSTPSGVNYGSITVLYPFTCKATDPDIDKVAIRFAWDNGDTSGWSAWVSSGDSVSISYFWTLADTYYIRAQAKDVKGVTSGWSTEHKIIITNIAQGTLKWRYQIENLVGTSFIRSSPAISSEDIIYVGSISGYLYAINYNGTLRWRYLTGWVYSSPAVDPEGSIYVGSLDSYLYVINPDGTLKWRYKTEGRIFSSPALGSDSTIYIVSNDGYLYALNRNGDLKWRYYITSGLESSPAIGLDGTIYVGANYLYAINPNGTLKWRFDPGTRVECWTPAIGPNGTIYVCSVYLFAINPDSTLKWTYQISDEFYSSPSIGADGTIYIGTGEDNGYLYAIKPTGSLKWRYRIGRDEDIFSTPTIGSDGSVYFGSRNFNFYAISHDGSLKWSYTTEYCITCSPAIGPDGTVYVESEDGYLYAFQGSGSSVNAPWPKFRHDLRNTGRGGGP